METCGHQTLVVGLTDHTLTCGARAHVPKSSGAPDATGAATRREQVCSRRDADRIINDVGGSAAGTKPGADRFSG